MILIIIAIVIITTVKVYSKRNRHGSNIYDMPAVDYEVPIPQPPPVHSIPPKLEMMENVAYLQVKDIDVKDNSAYVSST